MTTPSSRAGFAAIVGAPNAGKSTLVNAMVGSKVSIVSPKVQTTRMRVIGIAMADLADGGRAQVVLVDTPGIFRVAKRRLERAMVAAAWRGAEDADLVALVVDAERGVGQETRAIVERLKESRAPRFLILNKIDVVPRENLLALTSELNTLLPFERTFMVSALKKDGVPDVLATFAAILPPGPFLYPEDQAADLPLRLLAAEVTREQVFLQLHQELPYEAAVETEKWEVEVPLESSMLKRVVSNDHRAAIVGGDFVSSGNSVTTLDVRRARTKQFENARFVVSSFGQFSIAATDQAGTMSELLQHTDQHRHRGRLTRATRREVANADHRQRSRV